jgi:SAM-dependent methyltransferase
MREPERINVDVWRSHKVLDIFAVRDGFIDAGEAMLLERIADEPSHRPILDIGVGGGRTIPLLAGGDDGYVAVDFLQEMVELTRAKHPGIRVEQADARDLSGFEDDSFGAVLFSFNGIDGLAHEDRAAVHRAAMRVLRPGGTYLYSTHNLDFCCAGRPPWHRSWWDLDNGPRAMLVYAARLPRRGLSYRRLRRLTERGESWAVLVGSAYDFRVLLHYVTPGEALAELERAGFQAPAEMYGPEGETIAPGADTDGVSWLYLLARKPAP